MTVFSSKVQSMIAEHVSEAGAPWEYKEGRNFPEERREIIRRHCKDLGLPWNIWVDMLPWSEAVAVDNEIAARRQESFNQYIEVLEGV